MLDGRSPGVAAGATALVRLVATDIPRTALDSAS